MNCKGYIFLVYVLILLSCTNQKPTLFQQIDPVSVGIGFENTLNHTAEFNMYTYRNFYNGGGVGIGDINNDGYDDIFFCGNQADNKLYLNRCAGGEWRFEDITTQAGVASANVWTTGVSFADVNGDGWLDIYVCKSGKPGGDLRYNELFINNGDLTFTEKAHAYGIADQGFSSHAAFFDYDKDGDLDCYLLNNSFRPVGAYDIRPGLRELRDTLGGNKLYRNEQGTHYVDVSEEAGIYGSDIGFGLGVTIGDVNRDGWQDIYVSNDFFERDYLYINNQDGTFKEDLVNQMQEISLGSMGADMADINNDGLPEVFVTEMLPRSERRYKTKMTFENWDKYQLNVKNGYHHQFSRNSLQWNRGTGLFSEISRLAGVHATDWSWSALLADFDNDGFKDIYVSNGIYKDLLDQDYINYHSNNPEILKLIRNRDSTGILKLIDLIPSEAISNFAFSNNGDLTFSDVTKNWGLSIPSYSNGSAYGDLDLDGDLDLVVNNVNMPPFLFRNTVEANYLQVSLIGDLLNPYAIGAQVSVYASGQQFYQELAPMRGFQSSTSYLLTFGLRDTEVVDSVKVIWPDLTMSLQQDVLTNQRLVIVKKEGAYPSILDKGSNGIPLLAPVTNPIQYVHRENNFIDFDRDRLLVEMYSTSGPSLDAGDVNGDGLEDLFIGGVAGVSGQLYFQKPNGTFQEPTTEPFVRFASAEDTDVLLFDFDRDNDLDLYVASGGNEFLNRNPVLADRLYENDGFGDFTLISEGIPSDKPEFTSCVRQGDWDGDGDLDLFVGTRMLPGVYGVPVNGYLLENQGNGTFVDKTSEIATELQSIGLITDGQFLDIDNDGDLDLVVVGEWMPITILLQQNGKFKTGFRDLLKNSEGLWKCIEVADLDGDGWKDLIIGNHGLNTRLKASSDQPMSLFVNDFDNNLTAEQIITVYNEGESYPLLLRHDLVMQIPELKKENLYYSDYEGKSVSDLFAEEKVKSAAKGIVRRTDHVVIWNINGQSLDIRSLPKDCQITTISAITTSDLDGDDLVDIIMAGNDYYMKPEIGIQAAGYGEVLKQTGNRQFKVLSPRESGLQLSGTTRDIAFLNVNNQRLVLFSRNNDSLLTYEIPDYGNSR